MLAWLDSVCIPWSRVSVAGGACRLAYAEGRTPIGRLEYPSGVLGPQHVFAAVAVFGAVGLIATIAFRRVTNDTRPA